MAVSYDNVNPCENFHISSDLNDEETCQAHEFMLVIQWPEGWGRGFPYERWSLREVMNCCPGSE